MGAALRLENQICKEESISFPSQCFVHQVHKYTEVIVFSRVTPCYIYISTVLKHEGISRLDGTLR
jgi:hypothetical protein